MILVITMNFQVLQILKLIIKSTLSMKILYNDRYIQIFEDKIKFKSWVLPWGKKDVNIEHVQKISEKKLGTFSGKNRISGT